MARTLAELRPRTVSKLLCLCSSGLNSRARMQVSSFWIGVKLPRFYHSRHIMMIGQDSGLLGPQAIPVTTTEINIALMQRLSWIIS